MELKRVEQIGIWVGIILIGLGFWISGKHGAVSATFGSMIALASFRFWRVVGARLMDDQNKKKNLIVFACLAKLGILALVLWIAVVKISLEPLAFLLGLSSIVSAIFIEAIIGALKKT